MKQVLIRQYKCKSCVNKVFKNKKLANEHVMSRHFYDVIDFDYLHKVVK